MKSGDRVRFTAAERKRLCVGANNLLGKSDKVTRDVFRKRLIRHGTVTAVVLGVRDDADPQYSLVSIEFPDGARNEFFRMRLELVP